MEVKKARRADLEKGKSRWLFMRSEERRVG